MKCQLNQHNKKIKRKKALFYQDKTASGALKANMRVVPRMPSNSNACRRSNTSIDEEDLNRGGEIAGRIFQNFIIRAIQACFLVRRACGAPPLPLTGWAGSGRRR